MVQVLRLKVDFVFPHSQEEEELQQKQEAHIKFDKKGDCYKSIL